MNISLRKTVAMLTVGLAIYWTMQSAVLATMLDSTGWVVNQVGKPSQLVPPRALFVTPVVAGQTNTQGGALQTSQWQALFDNNPATFITLTNFAALTNVPGLLLDLGQTCAVDRVVFSGKNNGLKVWPNCQANSGIPPMGLIVAYVGTTLQTMTRVAEFTIPYDAGNPIDTGIDLRFSPVLGRYVRVELQTQVTWGLQHWPGWVINSQPTVVDTAWNVGEWEIYGCAGANAQANLNAVVLPPGAGGPLVMAANDLSYYLTELTGQPHPIITPSQTNNYPGTLYTIVDLKSLAPDYATMTNNMANGTLPTNEVNVTVSGRVVSFTGWPYRCVCWSVWEFLERQGVRWVAPDIHGDYVPKTGVSLAMLPLKQSSSAKIIYANWDAASFQPWPLWVMQSPRQEYLYVWRNRWTGAWNDGPIGGGEIPVASATGVWLDPQYSEGFSGYPHNMSSVLPSRILATNSAWWGSPDGVNYSPTASQFEMASTPAELWIAGKAAAFDAAHPISLEFPLSLNPSHQAYQLLPVDGAVFSIGTNAIAANALYGGPRTYLPWPASTGYSYCGGAYYKLLATVASNAPNQVIGGLAYSDIFDPPKSNYPSNVRMEVTLWGSPNLPLSSPVNANMWSALTNWNRACSNLANYDYALLFVDYWQGDPRLPVPMVSTLVTNANMLGSIGTLNGGCQALLGSPQAAYSLLYNPWDFYAYPRVRWNTNYTAANLLSEFFTGYYKEAATPMLAYYKAMEDHQYSNNIDLHNLKGYCYWMSPGSFPRSVLYQMQTNLQAAQLLATNWYVKNRIIDATNSWWYCCTNQGITDTTTLTDFSGFENVPASGTYAVDMSTMAPYRPMLSISGLYYPTAAVWNEGGVAGWHFDGATILEKTLNFKNAGDYKVDVVSYCGYYNGNWPSQRVFLGGVGSGSITVTNSLPMTNSFVVNVSNPTALGLVISQDANGQFLVVSSVRITKQ